MLQHQISSKCVSQDAHLFYNFQNLDFAACVPSSSSLRLSRALLRNSFAYIRPLICSFEIFHTAVLTSSARVVTKLDCLD